MNAVMGNVRAQFRARLIARHAGLKAASADEACPWCASTKAQRQDATKVWLTFPTASINGRQLVQVQYTFVDMLHLMLRIGDQVREPHCA